MKIFVGNMSKETSEQQLKVSFEKFGKVTSADIVLDKLSGKSLGFAFVEMPSDDDANSALARMDIGALAGRAPKVDKPAEK